MTDSTTHPLPPPELCPDCGAQLPENAGCQVPDCDPAPAPGPECPPWCETDHHPLADDAGRDQHGRIYAHRHHEMIRDAATGSVILCVTDDLLTGHRGGPMLAVEGAERMDPAAARAVAAAICAAADLIAQTG